ncbi:MAG: GDP-L-fucose synthase [Pseudomonadota bacterium]
MAEHPTPFELAGRRVWVAGHNGMVGAALMRRLAREDCTLLSVDRSALDLRDPEAVIRWMRRERPDAVFVAAARVGGILANARAPAGFLHDNLMIAASIMHAAVEIGVAKLLFLGSSCAYPRDAAQPIREEAILSGALEKTNEGYAIAKIAGVKLAEGYRVERGVDFISAMPTNLYGSGDNFDLASSHVLPALVRKALDARAAGRSDLMIWGSGTPRREFLHVDDCADALVHLMQHYSGPLAINVGCGEDIAIADLARLVMRQVGLGGALLHDLDKPDGTPLKRLDTARLTALGWRPSIPLEEGVRGLLDWLAAHPEAMGEQA